MAGGGFTLAKLGICVTFIVTIGLLGWILGLIYNQPERFLDNPLVSSESVTEESRSQCMQNCTECPGYVKGSEGARERAGCMASCRCCQNYKDCLDEGGLLKDCVEGLIECKNGPPPSSSFLNFDQCDLLGRHLKFILRPILTIPLIQRCIDMGAQVPLPLTGGCCRNATNTCTDVLPSLDCTNPTIFGGIYGGDGTTCPTAPCT